MQTSLISVGRYVYGAGLTAIAILSLLYKSFYLVETPLEFLGRPIALPIAGLFLLTAAVGIGFRRTVLLGTAAVFFYYAVVVVLALCGPIIVQHWNEYGVYENLAEQVAIAAAAFALATEIAVSRQRIAPATARLQFLISRIAFAGCLFVFGGAHFVFMDFTAPLVPQWLPPSQVFWAYFTGMAQIAAGLAILTKVRARLAAVLLTVMYGLFTPLVHIPLLLETPTNDFFWSENALNITLTGAAWIFVLILTPRVGPTPLRESDAVWV